MFFQERRIEYLLDGRHIFVGFARRQHHLGQLAGASERCLSGFTVQRTDLVIRHQNHASPLDQGLPDRRIRYQPTTNLDWVAAISRGRGEINVKCMQQFRHGEKIPGQLFTIVVGYQSALTQYRLNLASHFARVTPASRDDDICQSPVKRLAVHHQLF